MKSVKLNLVEALRRLPLFTDLSEEELALIGVSMSRVSYEAGTIIFAEGEVCRELLIVEEGSVRLLKSAPDGRRQLLSIERKGASLAELAVFDEGRYPATAEAATQTVLLRMSAEVFRKTCLENPPMALKVMKVLGSRLRHLVGLVEELSFSTVRARLIAFLVKLAEEKGIRNSPEIRFELTENNEELAARLGTVRELVSRNLGRLHGEGLIIMKKRMVHVPDLLLLRKEIEPPG